MVVVANTKWCRGWGAIRICREDKPPTAKREALDAPMAQRTKRGGAGDDPDYWSDDFDTSKKGGERPEKREAPMAKRTKGGAPQEILQPSILAKRGKREGCDESCTGFRML